MDYQSQSPMEQTARRLEAAVADLFAVQDVTLGLPNEPGALRLRGRLLIPPERAFPKLTEIFRAEGYTAVLRRDEAQDVHVLLAVPGLPAAVKPSRVWINAVLYVATILSTLFAGVLISGDIPTTLSDTEGLKWALTHLWLGWPFALSIMLILTGHELGHYFAGRYYKVAVTLPYFIPLPLSPLGTMGAFIAMKERTMNRRQMLAIAVAGPLTGLVLALPVLVIGLALSQVQPIEMPLPRMAASYEGNSLLYLLAKFAVFGKILPGSGVPPASLLDALREIGAALLGTFPVDRGYDVFIHPVAWAGWAGLLVTALNLLPVGQLDGGHVVYSLIGQRARVLTWPIIGLCVVLGLFFWPGWLLWAALIFFFGQGHPDPLDDVTRLSTGGKLVGILMLLVFVLTFSPMPFRTVLGPDPSGGGGSPTDCLAGAGIVLGAGLLAWRRKRGRLCRTGESEF
jgi:membrane-associated protease RseP (regulator of RpoE activity)